MQKNVILVEGISEQLLIPEFSKLLGIELEDKHIAIINIGGRYFDHFLKLFSSANPNAISKKIACITDVDPTRCGKSDGAKSEVCYPYELDRDNSQYDYKACSNNAINSHEGGTQIPNIQMFSQTKGKGKTFEYELALANPSNTSLIIDDQSNKEELEKLMKAFTENKSLDDMCNLLRASDENTRIIEGVKNAPEDWSDADKKKHLIASRYLNSIDKGTYAYSLMQLFKKENPNDPVISLEVPEYIKSAIAWVVND